MNKSGLGCIVLFTVIVVLGVTLYTTCPTEADHRTTLNGVLHEVIDDHMGHDDNLVGNIVNMIGRYALGKSADVALAQMLHVDNYYVVSIGRLRLGNHERIVSVGIFGHVFAPGKEDFEEEIDRYLKR